MCGHSLPLGKNLRVEIHSSLDRTVLGVGGLRSSIRVARSFPAGFESGFSSYSPDGVGRGNAQVVLMKEAQS